MQQVSRIELGENTAYLFAKLQLALGSKSAQRTFDELLVGAWYLITQGAEPGYIDLSSEPTGEIQTKFNFYLINRSYEERFLELKRRLSMRKWHSATNSDVVEHVVKTIYAYHGRFQRREG